MNKNRLLMTALGFTCSAMSLSADVTYVEAKQNPNAGSRCLCVEEKESRLQIGGDYTRVNLNSTGSSSYNGNLGGAQGLYEYRALDRIYGGARLAWKEGVAHADDSKRSLRYIDAQERIGYTFGFENDEGRLALFTGLGYRYMRQKLIPDSGSSLVFRYDEFYVPVGLLMDYSVCSWLNWAIGFIWMPQIYPTLSFPSLKGARWTLSNRLANFFVEVPFTFSLNKSKSLSLILNPFYERWEDGQTSAVLADGTALGIPENTYNYWGVDLNLAYCF